MSISVACPNCAAKLNAPDSAAGKRVKCPKCQTAMVVPEPEALDVDFEVVNETEAPKPGKGKPRVKTVVRADIENDEDDEKPRKGKQQDDEEDRPKKKKKKKRSDDEDEGGVSLARNIIMGVVLIILIGVAAYIFYDKYQKSQENSRLSTSDSPIAVTRS